MKKFIFVLALVLVSVICFSNRGEKGRSILNERYEYYPVSGGMLLPYVDKNTNLIGFVRNNSGMTIFVEACYEDLYYNGGLLMPVKQNGKWGIVDRGLNHADGGRGGLILPCEFDLVQVIGEDAAIVFRNGIKEKVVFNKL